MLEPGDVILAGFNSSLHSGDNWKPRANIGIVPLFPDKAISVVLVKHSLLLGKSLTDYLNPGQTPMQGMYHLIYAVQEQIQYKWNAEITKFCIGASRVANLFDMPDTKREVASIPCL